MPIKRQNLCFNAKRRLAAAASVCLFLTLSTSAFAQDIQKSNDLNESKLTQPSDGLNFNLPTSSQYEGQTGPDLELPIGAVNSTMLKLDLTSPVCTSGGDTCLRGDDRLNLDLADTFRVKSGKGLDLSLKPRASVRFNDELSSTAVGAVIEIGEDLREGSEFKSNTWYIFAGADAEALTYAPNSVGRLTAGEFGLQDRVIVGDAQAGLGYRIGDADVSLSYMRREASTEEFNFKEDAATLSFTWKR